MDDYKELLGKMFTCSDYSGAHFCVVQTKDVVWKGGVPKQDIVLLVRRYQGQNRNQYLHLQRYIDSPYSFKEMTSEEIEMLNMISPECSCQYWIDLYRGNENE